VYEAVPPDGLFSRLRATLPDSQMFVIGDRSRTSNQQGAFSVPFLCRGIVQW
jgi:hypothetical protein